MKQNLLILLPMFFFACQKKTVSTSQVSPIITQAQAFYNKVLSKNLPANNENFRSNQLRDVIWDQAQVKNLSFGPAVEVPVHFAKTLYISSDLAKSYVLNLSGITKLIIFSDSSGQFHYQVLTFISDSNAIAHPSTFTGIVLAEDWSGNSLATPERINQTLTASNSLGTSARPVIENATSIMVCTEIDGYNYAADDPDNGEGWSESTCTTYGFDAESGAGSSSVGATDASSLGGGSGGAAAVTVKVAPPNSVIASVSNYFQCFTNVGGSDHTYTVTVAIKQPVPGSREAWTVTSGGPEGSSQANNVINVGHTFLILTESYGNTTITRNIGFYPSSAVWPPSPSSPGAFGDDENDEYNVSGSFTLSNAQFFNILNYIAAQNSSSFIYNLNSNNCSTFAINAISQAGINLPRTIGTWPGGSGCDPADLGQDIATDNIPNISVNTNPPASHSNIGQCN